MSAGVLFCCIFLRISQWARRTDGGPLASIFALGCLLLALLAAGSALATLALAVQGGTGAFPLYLGAVACAIAAAWPVSRISRRALRIPVFLGIGALGLITALVFGAGTDSGLTGLDSGLLFVVVTSILYGEMLPGRAQARVIAEA